MVVPVRLVGRWGWVAVFLLLPLALFSGEETLFRLDGTLGKDGRAQALVTLSEGQQVLFRLASLDAPLRLRINLNGQDQLADPETAVLTSRFVHVRHSGPVAVTIEPFLSGPPPSGSFQLRIVRIKDTPVLQRSGVLKGSITRGDQRESRNRFVDWFPLPVVKGQKVLVGVSSRSADTTLRVEMPDGGAFDNDDAIGTDSRLVVEALETGIAWVGAGVVVRDEQLHDDLNLPYQVYVRDFAVQPKALSLGQAGSLVPFVAVADDVPPLPELYSFTAARAGVYRFRMEGRDGAVPVLSGTLDSGRRLVDSADRAGRDYAQLRCYLRQNQRVDLVAESLPGGIRQHYNLGGQFESPGIVLKDGDNLERSLADVRQGFFVYHGKAGEFVQFLMTSDDFETRLVASDPLGQLFTWSKYYGSDFSYASLGGYWFDQAGDLLLETGGKNQGDEGVYQLTVTSSLTSALDLPRDPPPRSLLAASTPVYFRLTDHLPAAKDVWISEFAIDLKLADLVSVRLQSNDLACALTVVNPDGSELAGSGPMPAKDSTLELVAPRTGRYLVRCLVPAGELNALNATATISFDLLGSAQALDPELVNKALELNLGDRPAGEYPFQEFPLRLRSNQHVYALVDSPDFQPALKLVDKDGMVVEENNGFGMKGRSRIDVTIQKPGTYRLRVNRQGAVSAVPGLPANNPHFTVSIYEIR